MGVGVPLLGGALYPMFGLNATYPPLAGGAVCAVPERAGIGRGEGLLPSPGKPGAVVAPERVGGRLS